MKALLSLMLTALAVFSQISAQTFLNREFFTIPKAISLQMYIGNDISDVDIAKTGIGIMWDFSELSLEQLDVVYDLQSFPDPDARFTNNTFRMIAKEGGSTSSAVEVYSLMDGLLLFRGLGMIDDNGRLELDIFNSSFKLLRFPLFMGESFFEDNQFRSSTRTLSAKGVLILPGEQGKQAYKFTETFSEGNTDFVEHSWFIDSIPYPIITIRDAFLKEDSSLLSRSIDVFKQRNAMSIETDESNGQEFLPHYAHGYIHIPKGITLQHIFNLHGEMIPFEQVTEGQFLFSQSSRTLFIVYLNAQQQIRTHIIQVIQ
ncbi:MAG: hypothetical protein FJ212_06800 [Ignavibacteria bacterium]|nr:hypothetical protein [Ignavibacteria bacterium]